MKHFIDTNSSEIVLNVRIIPQLGEKGAVVWENKEANLARTTLKPDSIHWFAPVTDQYGNVTTYTKVYLTVEDIKNIYNHIQQLEQLKPKGRRLEDDLPF
jgi:hypothetical protein